VAEATRVPSRPLAEILHEIKNELVSFAETRILMFQAEFQETAKSLRSWIPLAVTAGLLFGTAYVLLMGALVSLVAHLFSDNPFRWVIAFAIVGVIWMVGGFVAVASARKAFRQRGSFPRKTIEVLKADGLWLHDEVKRAA